MDKKALNSLINQGEGEKLDFKQTITSPRKIARNLVAFANTKGGRLLVGVKDNGRIKGIDTGEEIHMLEWASEHFCKPVIEMNFENIETEGKTVLVAEIVESKLKPHFALGEDTKWWAYIRAKDKCVLASRVMLDVMKGNTKGKKAGIKYGKPEQRLLNYLEKNERVTIKEFCKMANISRWRAQKILVNLVRMEVVKVWYDDRFDYYTL